MAPLTEQLIIAKTRTENISLIKNLNLWGMDLEDISVLQKMPSLEVLSLSVNKINSLQDFGQLPLLQELYLRKNDISDLTEIQYLMKLPNLKILWLCDNPCANVPDYRDIVLKALPNLYKLDNNIISENERQNAQRINLEQFLATAMQKSKNQSAQMQPPQLQQYQSEQQQQPQQFTPQKQILQKNLSQPPMDDQYVAQQQQQQQQQIQQQQQLQQLQLQQLQIEEQQQQLQQQQYQSINQQSPSFKQNNNFDTQGYTQQDFNQSMGGMQGSQLISNNIAQSRPYSRAQSTVSQIGLEQRNENIVCAVLALIKELDESSLEIIRRNVERRIGTLRMNNK